MLDLFAEDRPWQEPLALGRGYLCRRARERSAEIMAWGGANFSAESVSAPHLAGPHVGGTNCGDAGWTTDARGYQYSEQDTLSGQAPPCRRCFVSSR